MPKEERILCPHIGAKLLLIFTTKEGRRKLVVPDFCLLHDVECLDIFYMLVAVEYALVHSHNDAC